MLLDVSLYGDCIVKFSGDASKELRGTKHRALVALLVTAPLGRRSRAYLQEALWGESCFDGGRQSLRRALSDLRRHFGSAFDDLFETDNTSVSIHLSRVRHLTTPSDGEFLEGLDVGVEGFEAWLRTQRLRQAATVAESVPADGILPDIGPRIAVIPFTPVFDTRLGHQLGDWFAEDISRAISRSHFLSIISHLSCRQVRMSREVDLGDLAQKLGVDYVLVGSVRGDPSILVLDADLIELQTGRLLATRSFRGKVNGLQDLRSGITAEVSDMVSRSIVVDLLRDDTEDIDVVDIDTHRLLIMGVALMHDVSEHRFLRGRECLQEAIRRAPGVPTLKAWMAKWHVLSVINGWSKDPDADRKAARALTSAALDNRKDCALSLTMDGLVLSNLYRNVDAAGERYRQALEINPNDSLAWLLRGMQQVFTGDTKRGVEYTEKAHNLSPLDPFGYFYGSLRASAYCADGDFERALKLADRSIALNPSHLSTLRVRIAALHEMGQRSEARRAGQDLLKLQPNFRVGDYRRLHPSTEFEIGKRMVEALRASGIPD